MLMMPEPMVKAIEKVSSVSPRINSGANNLAAPHRIYLSPRGTRLTQKKVEELSKKSSLLLLCGHYEGVDQRVIDGWIDEEISIGDYVLTGGELPAMVLIDAVARHVPGVLGKEESAMEESFSDALGGKREYPHYTRPEDFRGMKVPEVLLSGNHKKIEEWRRSHCID
jgi:tRNA (guanine37-N1)-methyltransferase